MVLVAVMLAGCWPEATASVPTPPVTKDPNIVSISAEQLHQVDVVKVTAIPFPVKKSAIGQISFNEDASTVVLSPFSGRVTRIFAKIGEVVKRGQPLFEIDSPEVVQAQTDLIAAVHNRDKAKSALEIAKRQAERQLRLFQSKATSGRELDQATNDQTSAESDMKTAEGALNAARNRLRVIIGRDQAEVDRVERDRIVNPLVTINSPIDGTVIGRKIGPGQYVRSDTTDSLYSIADLSTMWLKANVPEVDIPLVHEGQEIEVRVTAIPNRVFKAQIVAIGAASDASTRRVVVRSTIANPDGALKSEMFANFKIVIGAGEPIASVPVDGVIREGEAAFVWVQTTPQNFQRRKIEVGSEQDGRLSVLSGLNVDDLVIGRGVIFVDNQWRQ